MSNKDNVIYFRAEPRLARAIREGAALSDLTISDYIRTVLRKSLGLEVAPIPDYGTNSDSDAGTTGSKDNLSYAK